MSTRSIVIPLAANQTGLTLSAQLVLSGGGASGGAITSGFTELGNGFYLWTYASFPAQFRGAVTVSAAGSIVAALAVNPEEAEDVGDLYNSGVEVATYASGQDPGTLVWASGTRTLTALGFTVSANMTEIAGQTVAAAGTVTFPASVGTSTYAGGAVASVTAPVTVGANDDKTGYSLSGVVSANVTQWLGTAPTGAPALASQQTGASIDQIETVLGPILANAMPSGTVVTGSSGSSVIVSGLPTGKNFVGQHLFHYPSGEARTIASQTVAGSNYVLSFSGALGTEAGPFSSVSAGDSVSTTP
jgi:hypothetical protein